jgi:hypothetical protein
VDRSFLFWDELKAYASAYALSSRALPVDNAAQIWLNRHLRLAFVGERMPADAFDYSLRELERMVRRFREQRVVDAAAALIRDVS